jgi:hypothetical protein
VRSLRTGDFFLLKGVGMAEVMYRNESEIRDVVERFERCEFALGEFTHARHLTVACWYLCAFAQEDALYQMRRGLQRFISHHGRQGYHETITRFWMELLGNYLCGCPKETLVDKVNGAREGFPNKDILYDYYSRELVTSDRAKAGWIEPDLRPIADSNSASKPEFDGIVDVLGKEA